MYEFIQVTTTTESKDDADRIAESLVKDRLAACVQVLGPITSTYRWEGKVEHSREWLCVVKTRGNVLPRIRELIEKIHPYDVPELIAVPIVAGSESYWEWMRDQLST